MPRRQCFVTPLTLTRGVPQAHLESSWCSRPNGSTWTTARPQAKTAKAGRPISMTMTSTDAPREGATSEEGTEREFRLTAGVRARTVVHICKSATLCTSSTKHAGVPFGSHVDFVQDEEGRPILLLSSNANHTKNLSADPTCSLFCQPSGMAGQDGCRVTMVGGVSELQGEDAEELKEAYIERHVHATEALQSEGVFRFYRMRIDDVLFVGGYGVISQWVNADEFSQARPDALAFDAPSIVAKLNEHKEADLKRLCRVFLNIGEVVRCKMTSLDCLGFDLRVRDEDGDTREYRVAFREAVSNRFDVQSALLKTLQEAWERENGFEDSWEGADARPTILYFPATL